MRYGVYDVIDGREIIYGSQFVTWERTVATPDDFYWGHYFDKFEEALKDFIER
jgi:hypothetical protein